LGPNALAAAVYGSVAHGAARRHSDLEMVVLTTEGVPAEERYFVRAGILVELHRLPASRMVAAAARVGPLWGVEADQYRHHWVLWDADEIFARVRAQALTPPDEAFQQALEAGRYRLRELWGKWLNAEEALDVATMRDVAWQFAHGAAMRLALHERRPYCSGRTLWHEAGQRSEAMARLVAAIVAGVEDGMRRAMEVVMEEDHERSDGEPPSFDL